VNTAVFWYKNFLNLIYPMRCVACGEDLDPWSAHYLCTEHCRRIHLIEESACSICGRKLYTLPEGDLICANCRKTKRHFDHGYTVAIYEEVIQTLIHDYKYRGREFLKYPLRRMLCEGIRHHVNYSDIDAIVPVPLHWRRYMRRGFNQALELVRFTSRKLNIPILKRNLRRIRYTIPQVYLAPKERPANIKGAFRVMNPDQVRGKRLMLVDDVLTTGSTMNECAQVLKEAGAAEITVVALAQSG